MENQVLNWIHIEMIGNQNLFGKFIGIFIFVEKPAIIFCNEELLD
jgi:hypothetical protein